MKIISQVPMDNGKLKIQFEGNSKETKPTGSFLAKSSSWIDEDSGSVYTYNGTAWSLAKNGQMKDLPVVTATDNGKVLKVKDGVWSVGEDGGGSGGGAEKFVVTFTQDAQTEEWTADKTVAEIVAADAAGKIVVAKYPTGGVSIELPLSVADEIDGVSIASFTGTNGTDDQASIVTVSYFADGSDANIDVNEQTINANAPLIVTLTAGATEGTFVGDKTYKEVYDAFIAGQNCILNIPDIFVAVAVSVVGNETGYTISASNEISASGSANDYITVTAGG